MNEQSKQIAERCLRGAHDSSMTFPQIVGTLIEGGFEGYAVDYRTSRTIYYRPDNDSVELTAERLAVPIAEAFDAGAVKAAINAAACARLYL